MISAQNGKSEASKNRIIKQEKALSNSIIKIIVLNCSNFIVFRFPSALFSFHGFFFDSITIQINISLILLII